MTQGMVWACSMVDAWHPPADCGVGLSDDRGVRDKGEGCSHRGVPVSHPI